MNGSSVHLFEVAPPIIGGPPSYGNSSLPVSLLAESRSTLVTTSDYTALDRPEISANSFYPRPGWTATPQGAEDHTIDVGDVIALSCRFFPVGVPNPTILFFYGNGETAVDYDNIAPLYQGIGANFLVADYRGYGRSGGSPSFSTMLTDAHQVLDFTLKLLKGKLLADRQHTGPVFVMGRSMGRHAAFELAVSRAQDINGVIIESGRPTLGQFANGLEEPVAQKMEEDYRAKVASINIPVLVIHGEIDTLAPLPEAVGMFQSIESTEKRMITVPGAGHNDLLYQGRAQYFAAVQDFVDRNSGQ